MLYLFAFIVSLVITMVLIPPVMKWAERIGAIDLPDERKVHKSAIPRVGGIAMVIGSMVSILFWTEFNNQIISLLSGYLILLFFGIWDDRTDLNYRIKFAGQILAVIIVVVAGDVVIHRIPFIENDLPLYIAVPFTIFALVGITNAINLSDGLDGLAGGTTLLSLSVIGLLAFQADGFDVVIIAMAVAGSIFGFLRYNTYPARLFMGDTGSQFLGFSAGVLAILLSQSISTAMSPVLPLIILGLPVLDTIAVMTQRMYEGRSPFSADKNHIHHKLLAIGFDHYEAVLLIYVVQSTLVIAAYKFLYESDLLLLSSYFLFCVFVLFVFYLAKANGWALHRVDGANQSMLRKIIIKLYDSGSLTTVPGMLLKLSIPLILIISVLLPDRIDTDISVLSFILLAILLINYALSKSSLTVIEKAVTYIVCVLAVYLLQNDDVVKMDNYIIINYLFIVMAVAFAIKIRFSKDRSFQLTPLDFLVVALVIVIPNVPGMGFEEAHIGEMALKLIVLFYVSETLLNIIDGKWAFIRIGLIGALSIAIIRGF